MERNETQNGIELIELWHVFTDNLWKILIIGLLAFALVAGYTVITYKEEYTSMATVYLISQKENSNSSPTASDFSLALNTVNDCTRTFKSHRVLDAVIARLSMPITYEELKNMITIENPDTTRYLEISVTAGNPNDAKIIVDNLCEIGAECIVEVMGVDQVNIVDAGTYSKIPSNSAVPTWCYIIAIGAAALVYAICLLKYMFDDKINTPDDVEKYVGLSVLGVIPDASDKPGKKYTKYANKYLSESQDEEGVR